MSKIFISYSSDDRPEALTLVDALARRGVACWIDKKDIPIGADYADAIMQGLHSCDATLVLISQNSVLSEAVQREVGQASAAGHRFHPVRLDDVVLPDEMARYLNAEQWINLAAGDRSESYARLAADILEGRQLAQQRARRVRVGFWSALAVLLVAVVAIGWGVFGQYQRLEQAKVLNEDPSQKLGRFAYSGLAFYPAPSQHSSVPELQTYHLETYEIPLQTGPVQFAAYSEDPEGTFKKVAFAKKQLTAADGAQSMEVEVVSPPESMLLCLRFRAPTGDDGTGPDANYIATQRNVRRPVWDPDRTFTQVDEGIGCDAFLDVVPDVDIAVELEATKRRAELEDSFKYTLVDELLPFPRAADMYQITFREKGGWKSANPQPERVTLVINTGSDGQTWTDSNVQTISANGAAVNQIEYRRKLREYVRLCAVTDLPGEAGFMNDEKVFQLNNLNGTYLPLPNQSPTRWDADGSICLGTEVHVAEEVPGETAISPIGEAIPDGSAPAPTNPGRSTALKTLASGSAAAYGPSVGGLQLGMSFSEAKRVARAMLPEGNETASSSELLRASGVPMGEVFELVDGQRYRSIFLVSFAGADGLGAAHLSYFPGGTGYTEAVQSLDLAALKARLVEVYRVDQEALRVEYPEQLEMYWTKTTQRNCVSLGLVGDRDIGTSWIPTDPSCTNILHFYGINYRGGKGPGRASIGLFDFQAMRQLK